jgi:hypothetical protein
MEPYISTALLVLIIAFVVVIWRKRRRGISVGPGSAGSFYEFLSEDRRAALEVIVEQRTGYRDPEDRDGNLPQLQTSSRRKKEGSD